jgi:hypothetical protein
MKHCCEDMGHTLLENRTDIGYCPKYREYYVRRKKDKNIVLSLWYCPWCGKKLPKSLRVKWFKLLEKEHGLDDPWSLEQEKLVPEEFMTDQWWKKRGL